MNVKAGIAFWTDERTDIMRAMAAQGASARQIGAAIGATKNAVISRMRRIGVQSARPRQPKSCAQDAPAPKRKRGVRFDGPNAPKLKPEKMPVQPPWTGPALTFAEVLQSGGCKFAVTPHDAHTHLFCGAPRDDERPYCALHWRIANVPPSNRRVIPDAERARRRTSALRRMASPSVMAEATP